MADGNYVSSNLILRSRGVVARTVDDVPPPGETFWLNESNLEELQENALCSRLGTTLVTKSGGVAYPLGGTAGAVHSISKLTGLNGNAWRYAGQGTSLYRLAGLNPGAYSLIYNAMSGQPWTAVQYQPSISSAPYIYFADAAIMLKDNGSLTNLMNTSSSTSTGSSSGGGTAWTNPGNIDSNSSYASVTMGTGGLTYYPSSTTGSVTAARTSPGPDVFRTLTFSGFSSVAVSSAIAYITLSGTVTITGSAAGSISLSYSVDGGLTFSTVTSWFSTFSSTTVPIVLTGVTNLSLVQIKITNMAGVDVGSSSVTATVTNCYSFDGSSGSGSSQILSALITGLSVPSNAVIVGVEISFDSYYSTSVPTLAAWLSVGTEIDSFALTTGPAPYSAGGPADLWAYGAWTPATLSSLSVNFIASSLAISTVYLNNLVVTVSYSVPAAVDRIGIIQPRYPVQAQAQSPDEIILDPFSGWSAVVSTTTAAAITATGIQTVPVANLSALGLFQSLAVDTGGSEETVLVIGMTQTGFIANFTKTHLTGAAVVEIGASTTVGASTTGALGGTLPTSISTWPTTLDQSDYIGLWLYVEDPNGISSITLQFNTANGAYFYRTIGQGPLQQTLNESTDSSTAAADAVISESLGLYTAGAGGVTGLNTVPGWTPILLQLSDFSGAGGADFNDPTMNWQNVTTYKVTIATGSSGAFPITIKTASLVLFGGYGPDSFAGVSYDYLVTLFNINDYTESNPCMVMTDVDPPFNTNRVVPRRQPVALSWVNSNVDPQATHWRVYRRGGTLADNYRRIDQIPLTAATGGTQTYTDIWSDLQIQQADTISFTNDVPVTSPLPVPLNNLVETAIATTNQVATVVFSAPYDTSQAGFTQSIFVGQQVTIGNVTADNFETVIVLTLTVSGTDITGFTAFVQNTHASGEPLTATAKYAQPVNIIAVAFDQAYYAGDPNNPSNIYWTPKGNIQSVSSAAYEPVNNSGDPVTAFVGTAANLYVSTLQRWWSISPGSNTSASPTIYPTEVDHGCVGPRAWTLRDGVVYYLALDGIRTFRGGGGSYISEVIEFVWQNTGPTPIPIADPTQFSSVQVSWWNRWVFFSYQALDGNRYRVVLDVDNKRFRTDNLYAESMYLEKDTGTLVWGDNQGLVHLDRQLVAYDETNVAGVVTQSPIAITLQTPYSDQGAPQTQKNYAEFTLDANTNGNPVTVELLFNDGEFTETIGTVTTTERQKVNLALNSGAGFQGYKVSMQLTGSGTERIYLYQAKIRHILLGETRTSYDSYDLRLGVDESKILKQLYVETTATAPITCNVYYDGNTTPGFTFTIPELGGVRNALRVRLPAIKFRIVRFIFTSASDFILWETSKFEWKPLCSGKSYSTALLMP